MPKFILKQVQRYDGVARRGILFAYEAQTVVEATMELDIDTVSKGTLTVCVHEATAKTLLRRDRFGVFGSRCGHKTEMAMKLLPT